MKIKYNLSILVRLGFYFPSNFCQITPGIQQRGLVMFHKRLLLTGLTCFIILSSQTVLAQEGFDNTKPTDTTAIKSDYITEKYGFTLQEEREIGFQSAIILANKYGYYDNPKVNEYINFVGQKVAKSVSKRPGIQYSFFVLNTSDINAFAVPGGFIFITKGALKILSNEAELAGVLAHEIAHVELGHGLEAIASNPNVRDRVRIMKINLQEGKGLTQQSLKSLLAKDKNITSGIVNAGKPNEDVKIEQTLDGVFSIK
jgi:hypothetical protein